MLKKKMKKKKKEEKKTDLELSSAECSTNHKEEYVSRAVALFIICACA